MSAALATEFLPSDFDPSAWPDRDPAVWPYVFDPADECDVLEWRDPRNSLGSSISTAEGHVLPQFEIDPQRPWMVRKVQYPDDLLHPVAEMPDAPAHSLVKPEPVVAKVTPHKVDPRRPAPTRAEVTIDADGFAAHHRERLLNAGHSIAFVAATGSKTLLGPEGYPEGAKHMDYLAADKFGLGLLYAHHSLDEDGEPWYQIETDVRSNLKKDGKEYGKYNESHSHRLMAHPVMAARFRQQAYTRLVLAEGTKQHLTMAGLLADEERTLTLGLAGCTAWSMDKGLTIIEDLDRALRCPTLKDVVVAFDADVKTKRGVHDAAAKLGKQVIAVTGIKPRFLNLPVGSGHGESAGFDDYIAGRYSKQENQ